jgi:hypothetical protein
MSLRSLTERTVTLRIEMAGESVDVPCRPIGAVAASRAFAELDAAKEDGFGVADIMIRHLSAALVDEDDRAVLPDLPLGVLSAMFRALTEGAAAEGKFSITRG